MEWTWILTFAKSEEPWRQGRKMLERGLRPGATASYRPMIEARTHVLLSRLLEDPGQWEAHIDLSGFLSGSDYPLESFNKCLGFRGS
jgi:cytochrome P450